MPSRDQILAGLTEIANQRIGIAVVWHAMLAAALFLVLLGWRPTSRTLGALVAALPASAAVIAILHGNPFNGAALGATALAVAALSLGAERGPVHAAPWWSAIAGAAMVLFGAFYPHFVDGDRTAYLYAAPLGLVPCPTLAVAIGLFLLVEDGDRGRRLTLVAAGTFYALFGVARLGVVLDLGLLAGAAALAATAIHAPLVHRAAS